MALTDTACKNAKCPQDKARLRLADSGGLYLEVVPTSGKLWRWKYRYAGKEKRLALGSYPAVTLAQARRARDDARDQLKTGLDPVAAKKLVKVAQGPPGPTTSKPWRAPGSITGRTTSRVGTRTMCCAASRPTCSP